MLDVLPNQKRLQSVPFKVISINIKNVTSYKQYKMNPNYVRAPRRRAVHVHPLNTLTYQQHRLPQQQWKQRHVRKAMLIASMSFGKTLRLFFFSFFNESPRGSPSSPPCSFKEQRRSYTSTRPVERKNVAHDSEDARDTLTHATKKLYFFLKGKNSHLYWKKLNKIYKMSRSSIKLNYN